MHGREVWGPSRRMGWEGPEVDGRGGQVNYLLNSVRLHAIISLPLPQAMLHTYYIWICSGLVAHVKEIFFDCLV